MIFFFLKAIFAMAEMAFKKKISFLIAYNSNLLMHYIEYNTGKFIGMSEDFVLTDFRRLRF